jgi:hypothetical protein
MSKRAEFALDTKATPLVATGNVAPVTVYDPTLAPGADREQERDAEGRPLWVADFIIEDMAGGDDARAQIAGVRIASHQRPVFGKYQTVEFLWLRCSVYVNGKTGQLGLNYNGELRAASPAQKAA